MNAGQRKTGGGIQSAFFCPRDVLAAAWVTALHSVHAHHQPLSDRAKSEAKPEYNIYSLSQHKTRWSMPVAAYCTCTKTLGTIDVLNKKKHMYYFIVDRAYIKHGTEES